MNKRPVNKVQKIEKTNHFVLSGVAAASGWIRPFAGVSANIQSIQNAYLGQYKYGSSMVQSIIDTRSAFITGDGLVVSEKQGIEAPAEVEYINSVFEYNQIDEFLNQIAVLTEIEGALLGVIEPIKIQSDDPNTIPESKLFNIKIFPKNLYNYIIVPDKEDAQVIDHIEYTSDNGRIEKIDAGEFVYKTFGSSLWFVHNVNSPRIGTVMEYIENVERAMQDFREINHLFSSPTPVFKCESQEECVALAKELKNQNWTIGRTIITTADLSLVELSSSSLNSVKEEIIILVERISGSTGVPIYFLGMSRLLNNRATASYMLECLEQNVIKERNILEGWLNEMCYNILSQSNKLYGTNYNVNSVQCSILKPSVLDVDQRILERLFKLFSMNLITRETVLNYIPEVNDVDEEIDKLDKQIANATGESNE